MGPSAEFLAEIADRDNSYAIAVFFFKERDSPGCLSGLGIHFLCRNRRVCPDLFVDQGLYL